MSMLLLYIMYRVYWWYFVLHVEYHVRLSLCCVFFVFKQKTAYEMRISDWSSDVCSSDLSAAGPPRRPPASSPWPSTSFPSPTTTTPPSSRPPPTPSARSAERRVG